jgi:hypothetical protein
MLVGQEDAANNHGMVKGAVDCGGCRARGA